jgi:ABC-type Fe3+/spermidine/putrescine transport system ATPase subunit
LVREKGITTLCVTHDIGDARSLGDYIILLAKGRILEKGRPREVLFRPKHPFAIEFLEINTLEGEVVRVFKTHLEVKLKGGQIWEVFNFEGNPKEGDRVLLLFRPEFVKPCTDTLKNQLECRVKEHTYEGFFIKLLLDCGGNRIRAIFPPEGIEGFKDKICIGLDGRFIHARR